MENQKIEVTEAQKDQEILDLLKEKVILDSINDETQMKRIRINALCEILMLLKKLYERMTYMHNMFTEATLHQNLKLVNMIKSWDNANAEEVKDLIEDISTKL